MMLYSNLKLWLIYILCAVRFTLVHGQRNRFTKDQLLNTDIKPLDKKSGLMWGWDMLLMFQRGPAAWHPQYSDERMQMIQQVGIEAQEILDDLKSWVTKDSDYYRSMGQQNQDYFQNILDYMIANTERIMISPGENEKQRSRQCFGIANTMLNSRLDIQRYYKVRYMYTWTLHYEIGYLSHEILRHYTVVIDLFHLVVTRFDKYRYDDHTPSRYMLYMYSVILQECKMIIKLCHMMHEVEKKYANFEDHTKLWREMPGSDEQLLNEQNRQKEANARAWKVYNDQLEKARLDKMRALKKKNKKALETFKGSLGGPDKKGKAVAGSGFGASGKKGKKGEWQPADYFYGSFNASNQKRSKFPHIYGWSIENFPSGND